MKKYIFTIIFTFLLLLSTNSIFAELFNHRNYLVGERSAMMGGAYTALSEDLSGAFYNPAGIAFTEGVLISLSASVYSYNIYSRKNTLWDENIEGKDFDLVPTSFGIAYSAGIIKAGISVFQTDNFIFSTMSINSDGSVTKWEMDSKSFLMGPFVAVKLTDSLGIGVSVFYHYYKGKLSYVQDFSSGDDYFQQSNIDSGGLTAHVGTKLYITDELQWGVNYGSQTINLHGVNALNASDGAYPAVKGRKDADQRLPHRISTGLAYEKENAFTLSLDFIYYFKLSYPWAHTLIHTQDPDFTYEEKSHFDISLGAEIYLSEVYTLRLGAFTNTSGAPDFEKTEKVDLYGGSFGLGYISEGVSSGLGVVIQYGKADWEKSGWTIETAKWERFSISLVIGGSKKF